MLQENLSCHLKNNSVSLDNTDNVLPNHFEEGLLSSKDVIVLEKRFHQRDWNAALAAIREVGNQRPDGLSSNQQI